MERSNRGQDMFFTDDMIRQRLALVRRYIHRQTEPITDIRFAAGAVAGGEKPSLRDADWKRVGPGFVWGKTPDSIAWFRLRIRIPKSMAGWPVAVCVDPGGQGSGGFRAECLAFLDGEEKQGIDRNHDEILLTPKARGGESHRLAVEAFTGMHRSSHTVERMDLVAIDPETQAFYWDATVAFEAMLTLDENNLARQRIQAALRAAVNALDLSFSDVPLAAGIERQAINDGLLFPGGELKYPASATFYESVRGARRGLCDALAAIEVPANREKVVMTGHAHIDCAWLWQLAHSRKKCGRSFSTVLELMDRHPDYHFFQSQPLLYQYTKEDYPRLYERIRKRVKEGRWQADGAAWVEMDTNVPSGESLVRQFLFGKRFLKREFGVDSRVLWLPDVFGYSWALPQIMKKSGVDYFMTTKISWNQYNQIPFDVFNWRGIDGTEALTCFIATSSGHYFYTYNGEADPATVRSAWDNFKGKDRTDEVMLSFGYGDGGGGPNEAMLEHAERLADFPAMPRAEMSRIDAFFDRLAARGGHTHVWNGELYFELHRGTVTTQAATKKNNRRCEIMLHDAEFVASLAWLRGEDYPTATLNAGWEKVLTHQFHDILPGSSIPEVYEDATRDYTEVLKDTAAIRDRAARDLCRGLKLDRKSLVVFNTMSWRRDDVLSVAATPKAFLDGARRCPSQDVVDIDGEARTLVAVTDVPSKGAKALTLATGGSAPPPDPSSLEISPTVLENRFFRIRLNRRGEIASIRDKVRKREVVPKGEVANRLLLFEDRPLYNDAWDIDIFYNDKAKAIDQLDSLTVIEEGPVRGGVEIRRVFGRSRLRQRVLIYDNIPRIDFETEVDWQERRQLLKAAFPVDVHSDYATYEIQFGAIKRPTHWNHSWDWAKFEVCGHRWADLSEDDYGVSLMNDCKYGYDIKDNVMRQTLLRGSITPDAEADLGRQVFTYSLFPHGGNWTTAGTTRRAAELNFPLFATPSGPQEGAATEMSFVSVDRDDVVVETVKKAEDRKELVVRLYENANRRGPVTLTFAQPVKRVRELNLLEEVESELKARGNSVTLQIKPFEIRTLGVVV